MELEDEYKRGTVKNISQKMIDYCFRDCEIVYKALLETFYMAGCVRLTAASLALAYFRNKHLSYEIKFEREKTDLFFDSYFGGRVEAFRLGNVLCNKYDVNSEYPYVMSITQFPHPSHLEIKNCPSKSFLTYAIKFFEGMGKFVVKHKNTFFGSLPVKLNDKLIFPTGIFSGHWNFNELRFAIEIGYVEILACEYICYSQRLLKTPFDNYVKQLYKVKQTSKHEAEILKAKIFLNTLYGKFGEKLKYETMYLPEIDFDFIELLKKKDRFIEISLFSQDRKDCMITYKRKKDEQVKHAIASFASYITSAARIYLLKNMLENESKGICYCDTDSIFSSQEINFVDNGQLGEWKLENDKVIEIRGNKNYTYTSNKEVIKKIKGVPKGAEFHNGVYLYKALVKSKLGLRKKN
ncbi:MAG: hypothetical protein HC905_26120 [Bacteroidales bacterium]|nr:hypothetical protein [Bacteroidales bacterium]